MLPFFALCLFYAALFHIDVTVSPLLEIDAFAALSLYADAVFR